MTDVIPVLAAYSLPVDFNTGVSFVDPSNEVLASKPATQPNEIAIDCMGPAPRVDRNRGSSSNGLDEVRCD